jgi:hypothetical protein
VADERAPALHELLPAVRNFTLSLAERVRAQEGVPAHLRRKRAIEDGAAALVKLLRERRGDGATEEQLRRFASRLDLTKLNDLVDRHNRWYPIEANLPIDPRSGRSLDGDRPFAPLPLFTAESLLAAL